MNRVFLNKARRALLHKCQAVWGSLFYSTTDTIHAMTIRPYELSLELTNLCNANCIFCPYQYQHRQHGWMSDEVFYKAVGDFVALKGGSVGLTPIVGDPLIDPKFLERVRYLRSLPEIDRISCTTNGILLDKFGIDEVLTSGLTSITISTSGFDESSYKRVYRSSSYTRMKENVQRLVERNAALGKPVVLWIALRTDRPITELLNDADFQPILKHAPSIDFTWSFTSAGGRISRETLPTAFRLRTAPPKKTTCAYLLDGPIVLTNGDVLGCSCVAAMDAVPDLYIGNILENNLRDLYGGPRMAALRAQFSAGGELNDTCAKCEQYKNADLYKTPEGRRRAELNMARFAGRVVRRQEKPSGPFARG